MEMEKSKVSIQFLSTFRQSGDVLFFLYARRLRGYTATIFLNKIKGKLFFWLRTSLFVWSMKKDNLEASVSRYAVWKLAEGK